MNKVKAILAIVVLMGSLAVFEAISDKDCITVYVDYGTLEKSTFNECIKSSETKATDLLINNNFTLQGTDKYGTAVLCRLNNLPKEEECKDMPSENAYWAILVKEDQILFED